MQNIIFHMRPLEFTYTPALMLKLLIFHRAPSRDWVSNLIGHHCQLDPYDYTPVKFDSRYNNFHKCCRRAAATVYIVFFVRLIWWLSASSGGIFCLGREFYVVHGSSAWRIRLGAMGLTGTDAWNFLWSVSMSIWAKLFNISAIF